MYAKAEKPKTNKHISVANSVMQKKKQGTRGVVLADNRPSVISPQQPDSTVIQLNKKDKRKQKNREKQQIFKRRQNLKNAFLNAQDPSSLRIQFASEFKGDELAMANLNNAWKDFQIKQNSKSDKKYRAELMNSLMKEFSLVPEKDWLSDNVEVTDESDGEQESHLAGKESGPYEKGNLNRRYVSVKKLGDYKSQGEILARLVEKRPEYQQLAINLALHNFRTSLGGGRPQFRFTGHVSPYSRPFEDMFSEKMIRLLREIRSAGKTGLNTPVETDTAETDVPEVAYMLPEKYVPPTKFAVTLPVDEAGLQERIAQSPNKELKPFIDSFSNIGSFGFSERSKTSWNAEVGEAEGTRLSLGEGISTAMYVHLENLVSLVSDKMEVYKNFGSPDLKVLKVHAVDESQLKVRRANHLSEMEDLIARLKQCVEKGHEKILGILNKHRKFFKKEEESEHDNFIIRESDLWEELVHVSTLLSEQKINTVLNGKHYRKINHSKTTEDINVNGEIMRRHLFSSGSKAAHELYEHLGGRDTNIKQRKGSLNTYTPYFEFYLGNESLLTRGSHPEKEKMQAWINLSENAHDLFFEGGRILDMDAGISTLSSSILKYIKALGNKKSSLKLVIDYTKFGSDLPKSEIYPLLSTLKNKLVSSELISSVYYLKSALKYNTGAIERYQSGEVLSYEKEENSAGLENRAAESFEENPQLTPGSALNGHYIDLMRKVDILADHILTLRRKRLVG